MAIDANNNNVETVVNKEDEEDSEGRIRGKHKIIYLIDQMMAYKEKNYTDVEIREQIFTFLITVRIFNDFLN